MVCIPRKHVPAPVRDRVRYTSDGAVDLSDPISEFALRWGILNRVWGCDVRNTELSTGASGQTYRLVGYDETTRMHYGVFLVEDAEEPPGILMVIGDDTLTAILRTPRFRVTPCLGLMLVLLDVYDMDARAHPSVDARKAHAAFVSATTDA